MVDIRMSNFQGRFSRVDFRGSIFGVPIFWRVRRHRFHVCVRLSIIAIWAQAFRVRAYAPCGGMVLESLISANSDVHVRNVRIESAEKICMAPTQG